MSSRKKKQLFVAAFSLFALVLIVIAISSTKKNEIETVTVAPAQVPVAKVAHRIIGKSVEGRNIEAYTYGDGPTRLLFVGGIHGGYEWNSVVLAYDFIDYLKANPSFLPTNTTIAVIPDANPDGTFRVTEKEGRFTALDIPTVTHVEGTGRFNAHNVDLNRNFACNWKSKSTWKSKIVSAGTSAFSEPEAIAIRDFVLSYKPAGAVFWHSKANAVYASECNNGILPKTLDLMNAYSQASGYGAVKAFSAYEISGDAEGWLASIGIPAITVELRTHETIEWDKNLAGIRALLKYYDHEI